MIDISLDKNYNLYTNWIDSYNFLDKINNNAYNYPEEIVNFHIYSEIKTEKELECIKSLLATQNLEKINLVLWSDYDVSNSPHLMPYKKYINFKIYDPIKEAKGTVLEDKINYLMAKDSKYYIQSDILRILALHKYGGIWSDMDMIFLRDFKPILDQEYMYQWGNIIDFEGFGPCGSILSLKKNSELSNRLINGILNMPIVKNSTIFGKDLFAKLYKEKKYTIFPSSFFNIEWLIDIDASKGWFEESCADDLLFLNCFSWHWHNTGYKNKPINYGSKFFKLQQITNKKLKQKGFKV